MAAIAWELGVIVLLLLANGVFAMAELAVVSARKVRLKQLADGGSRRAKVALSLAEGPDRFLATVQIGITLVGIVAGVFGGATLAGKLTELLREVPTIADYAEPISFTVVVLIITYFSLVLGELLPKRLALSNPEGVAMFVARPMHLLATFARPVVTLLSGSTDLLLRLVGIKPSAPTKISEDEVKLLMREGLRAGVFLPMESVMVGSVLALDRLAVRDLMTPRGKIIWINVAESHDSIWHKIVVSGHSIFPVYETDRDHVVGVIALKSIYANLAAGVPVNVRDLMTPPFLVPAAQKAHLLLETFKQTGRHYALATDEAGRVAGVVTLHDLLEAVLGDFPSPEERSRPTAKRRDDGSWLVDGSLPVAEFRQLVREFPLEGTAATFGEYVAHQLGQAPTEGGIFVAHGFDVEVIDMDGSRVDKVLLIPRKSAGGGIPSD
jgi:putative hemolysin